MATKGPYNTLAAAGTTQATAAAMNADMVMVTSGTGGVILPALDVGQEVVVCNGVSTLDLNVYPISGGKINNATADLPLVLPSNKAARFKAVTALDVIAFF